MTYAADYSSGKTAVDQAVAGSYQPSDLSRFCNRVSPLWVLKPHKKPVAKINYVIATWSGPRRAGNSDLLIDPTYYLRQQLISLGSIRHQLQQITIVVPDNPEEPKEFTEFLATFKATMINPGSPSVEVLRRPNEGQSYGSWIEAYLKYTDEFEYYIFVEDDYKPVHPNFDQILAQMYETSKNCGYLCSLVTMCGQKPHAAISNGIVSAVSLKKIQDKLGEIPFGRNSTAKDPYCIKPQLDFSWAFVNTKLALYDYCSLYSSPFNELGLIKYYGDTKKPPLFSPIQRI